MCFMNPFFYLLVIIFLRFSVLASTDLQDVMALQDLYTSLNRPQQLAEWHLGDADPCNESWTGITCSGSSVISIKLRVLNLTGNLGQQLHTLKNLKHLEINFNHINGQIPNTLPLNATFIDLSSNNLSQSLPLSLSNCKLLRFLNISHNTLSGPIGNVFEGLDQLKEMDLSYNKISGDLPSSFANLTNLTNLFLQNNKFTGSVVYLSNLPLHELNIEANNFSGVLPNQFKSIKKLSLNGNVFHEDEFIWKYPLESLIFDSPPTHPSSTPVEYPILAPPSKKKDFTLALTLSGVVLLFMFAAVLLAYRLTPRTQRRNDSDWLRKSASYNSNVPGTSFRTTKKKTSGKTFTFNEIETATNSFDVKNHLGGCVYRSEFPDGKLMAVRTVGDIEDDVLETLVRLRHANLVNLVGYCTEHRQRFLVYDFVRNLSLEEVLHSKSFTALSWPFRLAIALGVARAVEYLHSARVAHGNLKAGNVLLDEDLFPRVTDFGLKIVRPVNDSFANDVYDFGVLLLELFTGRRPVDDAREEPLLAVWASPRLRDRDWLMQMVDPAIKRTLSPKSVSRFADIISLCIQGEKVLRPKMTDIVEYLTALLRSFSGVTEVADDDHFCKSFRSTHTNFMSSPTLSFVST